jgi:hypothetical protein
MKYNGYIMLSIRLKKKQGAGLIVWQRDYFSQNELVETVKEFNSSFVLVERWDNKFFHWISKDLVFSVKQDYVRLGWEVLQYNR